MVALFCALFLNSSWAANLLHLNFGQLMQESDGVELLNPEVKISWGDERATGMAETSLATTYRRSGLSVGLFGGGVKHCKEGFFRALGAMISDAQKMGYDRISNIHAVTSGSIAEETGGFACTPGYRTTEVALSGVFGMSERALANRVQSERQATELARSEKRPPAKNAIYLSLTDVLNTPEAKALFAPNIKVHAGFGDVPPYNERFGFVSYSEEGNVKKLGAEAGCKDAVLNTLEEMINEFKETNYRSIITLHSYWNDKLPPVDADYECSVDGKTATVALRASFITAK
ncbi:hypothetical protein GCM10027046_15530 [Uliginosibacterium flavum]|uniref:Uncharacterized protein n=1 Tax=Uliginosibacterium flavum TaxID=1396831 RepID=A0ABV2TN05_9RHOO